MFGKLALRNVRRQISDYLIYFVSVTFSVALLFAISNMVCSEQLRKFSEVSSDMNAMVIMMTVLAVAVTAFVLGYATSFMLKLRKNEFGMYLTLGMTRKNIQTLFLCETWIMCGLALVIGILGGLLIYQLLMAFFSSLLDIKFEMAAYSIQGVLLTVVVSAVMFLLADLGSLRYLRKISIQELFKVSEMENCEKHPARWTVISVFLLLGTVGSIAVTYRELMKSFETSDGVSMLLWLVVDYVLFFFLHVALSRAVTGIFLARKSFKNRGANTVVLRGLSSKMMTNSIMIGVMSVLLLFSIMASNIAFSEKVYNEKEIDKRCPYDAQCQYSLDEDAPISKEQAEKILNGYSPIASKYEWNLYSANKAEIVSNVLPGEEMDYVDKYVALSQFNKLLTDCGFEPVSLQQEYLVVSDISGIVEGCDFSDSVVTLNGKEYTFGGGLKDVPDFINDWMYLVVPDEAIQGLSACDVCAVYDLEQAKYDAMKATDDLHYSKETLNGPEEESNFRLREYLRLMCNASSGVIIISMLYVSTVFICMTLAVLSLKTLSTLEEERRRFAVLYRLGLDEEQQKKTLFRQIFFFFIMPFGLPLSVTVPMGYVVGKVQIRLWSFCGLTQQTAMITAIVISSVILGIYALYFLLTYQISKRHIICYDGVKEIG